MVSTIQLSFFLNSTKLDHKFRFSTNSFSGIRIISNPQILKVIRSKEVVATLMINYTVCP